VLVDHLQLRSGNYLCRLRDGLEIEVRGGTDDRHVLFEVFAERIYPLPCRGRGAVVDVGAQIGCFTLLAARAGHRVLALEPSPANFSILCRNVERNSAAHVELIQAAVGERRRTGRLVLPDDASHTGRFSLCPGRGARTVSVRVRTLDEILRHAGIERVALLKIDCQGSEYEILYSAGTSLLERIDSIAVECEVFPDRPEWSLAALQRFLEANRFQTATRGNLLYANRTLPRHEAPS
jgi:FkbM family methyltransferase